MEGPLKYQTSFSLFNVNGAGKLLMSLINHEWLSDSGFSKVSETIYLEWMVLYMHVNFFQGKYYHLSPKKLACPHLY